MSINIKGNNTTFTTGNNSPITFNKSRSPNNKQDNNKIYKEWWVISSLIGCMGGSIIGFNFNSFYIGLSSIIIITLTVLFFNPKRRFMKIGLMVISMGCLNILPSFSGLFTISKDNFIIFEKNTSPILGIFLIVLSAYLFYLDSQQK